MMITLGEDFEANLLSAIKDSLKGDNSSDEGQISNTFKLVTAVINTFLGRFSDDNNQIQLLSDRCSDQEKRSDELDRQIEKQNKQIEEQNVQMVEQAKQVGDLTNKVTKLEHYYRSTEVSRVRDNIVIKTSKTTNEISEYLADTIKKGCGEKPSLHLFSIQLIVQKKGLITPF